MKKHVSVSMVNTRSNKQEKELQETIEEKLMKRKVAPVTEVDLETPEQSINDIEKKMTESTIMTNAEQQETKKIEIAPAGNGNEVTSQASETKKDGSQTKRNFFTEGFAPMAGIRPRDKEEVTIGTNKGKTSRTVSAIITEVGEGGGTEHGFHREDSVSLSNACNRIKTNAGGVGRLDVKIRADEQKKSRLSKTVRK